MQTNAPISQLESNHLFSKLPYDVRQRFYAEASGSDLSGQAWFYHEIPDELKSDPEGVRILLNGGEVTVDGVTHTIDAHEFSRIQAGVNGGEYTPDNVILESEALNGARGGTDMTVVEHLSAETELAATTDVITSRATEVADAAVASTESLAALDVVEAGLGVVTPVLTGLKVGKAVLDEDSDNVGGAVAATAVTGVATFGAIAACPALAFAIPAFGLLMWLGGSSNK